MKITFNKNIQFTRLIKIRGRLKEFNFRKANTSATGSFTVDVLNDQNTQGNRIIFHMEKKGIKWKIVTTDIPEWILEREDDFDEIIEEELKKEL